MAAVLHTSLTHWGWVTHICVDKLIIIGSDNGLSPGWRQAIIWTNAEIWSMRPLRTNFSEILIKIHTFSFKKMHLRMSSAKCRPFCLGLNVLSELFFPRHSPWRCCDMEIFFTSLSLCKGNRPVTDYYSFLHDWLWIRLIFNELHITFLVLMLQLWHHIMYFWCHQWSIVMLSAEIN